MDTVDAIESDMTPDQCDPPAVCIQQGSYLLELSLDWIVLRASENIHLLLGESHDLARRFQPVTCARPSDFPDERNRQIDVDVVALASEEANRTSH